MESFELNPFLLIESNVDLKELINFLILFFSDEFGSINDPSVKALMCNE